MFRNLEERLRAFENCRAYPVLTGEFCSGRPVPEVAESLLAGGAGILQIREKEMNDADFFELVKICRSLTERYHALLIVDDRVDVALAAGADGVHLGMEDLPLPAAKKIAPELLIGVSTHNEAELEAAQKSAPGYINIGPIFATGTKRLSYPPVGMEELSRLIPKVKCPFSVMGGIKYSHLATLKALGVKHIAAVTAFSTAPSPGAVLQQWQEVLM